MGTIVSPCCQWPALLLLLLLHATAVPIGSAESAY